MLEPRYNSSGTTGTENASSGMSGAARLLEAAAAAEQLETAVDLSQRNQKREAISAATSSNQDESEDEAPLDLKVRNNFYSTLHRNEQNVQIFIPKNIVK